MQCHAGIGCASELIELGFPASSPSGVEPAGELVSVAASLHGYLTNWYQNASVHGFPTNSHQNDTDVAQNGAGLVEKGFPDSNFWLKKQDTYVSCFAPIDLTKHGSDLAQNGAELSGNVGHNSIVGTKLAQNGAELVQHGVKMESKFVPVIELLEYGFPVSPLRTPGHL